MGIKGLLIFLRTLNPEIHQECELKEMKGYRIAVDVAIKAYAYKSEFINRVAPKVDLLYNDVDHAESTYFMISRILMLYRHIIDAGCLPVSVLDGPAPSLKDRTREERRAKSDKRKNKILHLRRIGRSLLENREYIPTKEDLLFLASFKPPISSIDGIRERLLTEVRGLIVVTSDDYLMFATILANIGLPYITAESEAERTCAILARNRDVIAAITTDSDSLVYGCPIMIDSVKMAGYATVPGPAKITTYSFKNVLAVTGLTHQQFIEFCIMCGTDFNKNSKGFGPSENLKLLHTYGSLKNMLAVQVEVKDRIAKNPWTKLTSIESMILAYDYDVLNYDAVSEFFVSPTTYETNQLNLKIVEVPVNTILDMLLPIIGKRGIERCTEPIKKIVPALKALSHILKY